MVLQSCSTDTIIFGIKEYEEWEEVENVLGMSIGLCTLEDDATGVGNCRRNGLCLFRLGWESFTHDIVCLHDYDFV